MSVEPNIQGFRDAQVMLRDRLGTVVTFLIPPALTEADYPDGTAFDPETGLPFDPVVEPIEDAAETTEVEIKGSVVHRPVDTDVRDSALNLPMGLVTSPNLAVLINADDKESVEGATEVVIWGKRHRISEFRPDGLTELDRWIVFCQEL